MLKRSVRAALSVAVVAAGTAVAFQLATGSASADDFAMELPIRGFGDVAVDGKHKRIFLSDPTGGQLVTVDYNGKVLATKAGLPGLADLELSHDGSRLYAAWPDGKAVVAFDPAGSAEVARYDTGTDPTTLAQAGGKLWFGDKDGLGSLDLSGPEPVVTTGKQMGGTQWTTVPQLAATPGRPDVIVAAGNTYLQGVYQLLDITTTPPTVLASTQLSRNIDMAFTADGSRLVVADASGTLALSGTDLSRVETYRSTGLGNAVAVRTDGTLAFPARDGAGMHTPGTSEAVREFRLQDPNGEPLSLTGIAGSGLAWEPGGRRLFGIALKSSTAASNPGPWFSLQVLNTLKTVSANLSVPAEVQPGQSYSVTGFVRPAPAGSPLVITRSDAATPGGRRVGPEAVSEDGMFEFQDSQAAPGKVTYTLSFSGDDTYGAVSATESVLVAVPKKAATLTLDRNGSAYNQGTTVTFTAKLGPTGSSRTVEIWADPSGGDQPNRLLRKANVDAKGSLTASLKLTRNTTLSAIFRGDDKTLAKTVKSTVATRASVATTVSRHYKTAKIGSVPTYHFRKTKHPLFTTTMTAYPGRKAYMQIDVLRNGKWIVWGPGWYPLSSAGKVTYELKGTHSVGVRYRVRFAYLYAKSGDTANVSTYGPYRYFTFTK
ncbi:YncE family protein [Paractinoplanes brasiliensis]|uniref:DNA-binding beta-propeller fold protein YncE n=1 Tax=Paractinoplanes brasiliensis TaxID=52695 RepID=A0A4R6JRC1_9ACTN|nr:hypothetical protein [Actinoplanes brasiliensis]TDO37195.1 hypothetical protein C8E87_0802 [Actinoplanes brasiliensis]GID32887.1 hypothetical protein Abr02nite_78700 [Actinoplanes brasiliensis]